MSKGKKAKKDSGTIFPKNRWEVFWDVSVHRIVDLLKISILTGLFFLQLFAWNGYNTFAIAYADYQQEKAASTLAQIRFYQAVINVPCVMFAALGVAGGWNAIQKIAHAELAFVSHDFWDGFKNNWWVALLLGLLMGLSGGIFLLGFTVFQSTQLIWTILGRGLCAVQFLFFGILSIYGLAVQEQYELRVGQFFVVVLKLFFLEFPVNLAFFIILSIGLGFFYVFANPLIHFLGYALTSLILLSLAMLVGVLWTSYSFDHQINRAFFPQEVDKGVWRVPPKKE